MDLSIERKGIMEKVNFDHKKDSTCEALGVKDKEMKPLLKEIQDKDLDKTSKIIEFVLNSKYSYSAKITSIYVLGASRGESIMKKKIRALLEVLSD